MSRATMKILVAEDSSLLRTQMTRMLSDLDGIEVVGGPEEAVEACRAVRELKPDVVILDILMRNGNGIELLRRIKRNDSSTVVIVLTQDTSPPYWRRATEAGADFFLNKSTEFGKLREIIQLQVARFNQTQDGIVGALS